MKRMLSKSFFKRNTIIVAGDLLGKFLVRKNGKEEIIFMITEVEVYDGFRDKGSHASRGETARNTHMFQEGGRWYVYFTYGMHWMLNVVTREKGYPAAILIRGVQGVSGPARITKRLSIDKKLNGKPVAKSSGLWIEDRGVKITPKEIKKTGRIGIQYAGPYWAKRKWRFLIANRPDFFRNIEATKKI